MNTTSVCCPSGWARLAATTAGVVTDSSRLPAPLTVLHSLSSILTFAEVIVLSDAWSEVCAVPFPHCAQSAPQALSTAAASTTRAVRIERVPTVTTFPHPCIRTPRARRSLRIAGCPRIRWDEASSSDGGDLGFAHGRGRATAHDGTQRDDHADQDGRTEE